MNKISDQEIVLLLTATVTPQFNYMAHSPDIRLKQYIEAIQWYLDNTSFRIIIGENSGCYTLIDYFAKKFEDRMELVCYKETNTTRQFGYNEMLILKNVYDRSVFLKSASLVFKITGRLIVKNLAWHVAQLRYAGGGLLLQMFSETWDILTPAFLHSHHQDFPTSWQKSQTAVHYTGMISKQGNVGMATTGNMWILKAQ